MAKQIGYIRVNKNFPIEEKQLETIALDKIFQEEVSINDSKRVVLKKCLSFLKAGDTLHVHSFDRLAGNIIQLEEIITDLLGRSIIIVFHKEGLVFHHAETPEQQSQLKMLSALSGYSKTLLRERQVEGIVRAKAKGKKLGRHRKLSPEQIEELQRLLDKGVEKKKIAKHFGISRQTLYNTIYWLSSL